jgi:RNA-directed DNA polymerase
MLLIDNIQKKINNLIKMVAGPDLLAASYHKLKSNQGSLTSEVDDSSADEQSYEKFLKISEQIMNRNFKWLPVRKVYIPKPGKSQKRPLGIPSFDNRIVQESIRMVLNSIYEPIFQEIELNFGFRPKRSTAHAKNRDRKTRNDNSIKRRHCRFL